MNILTQSFAITESMFNSGKYFTKNAINFVLTEMEKVKIYFIGLKLCCASNAATKNGKIANKKKTFFFQENRNFPKKYEYLKQSNIYFLIMAVFAVILTSYLIAWSNRKAIHKLFPT